MKTDPIGYFKGKAISQMSRDELLDFARFAGRKMVQLEIMVLETEDYRLTKEALGIFTK